MALIHPFYGIEVYGLLYSTGREGILDNSIDYLNDTIRVGLVNTTYVYDEAHETVADLGASFLFWSDQGLLNKAATDGYAASDAVIFTGIIVPEGEYIRGYVLVQQAAVGDPVAGDRLLCFGDDTAGFSTFELGEHDAILRPSVCGPYRAWFRA